MLEQREREFDEGKEEGKVRVECPL